LTLAVAAVLAGHGAAPAPSIAAPRFIDVTVSAGFNYEHGYTTPLVSEDGSFDERRHTAGGVAAGDYDNDGFIDLYAVRGDIGANLLFHNRGDGTFEEVGSSAGVAVVGTNGSGPTFADIDGDGWLDLLIGGVQQTHISVFRNRGDGTFVDVTPLTGLTSERDSYSAAFGDYDRDGDLDLLLSHWDQLISGAESSETLWRNDGDWRFTDVSRESGITRFLLGDAPAAFDFTFTPNFADIDSDGWPDILMANDFKTSKVLHNQSDGTFADVTDNTVITDENGMGAAIGDYDNDGDLDWFVSSIWDPDGVAELNWGVSGNRLYRGRGDGTFDDVTEATGVRAGYWGWGATWADVNNDGYLDLFHVNGFGRSAEYEPTREFYRDPTVLFLANGDGSFSERARELGIDDTGMGRGVVSFDFDRDGDLDLFLTNNLGPPRLFRNDDATGASYLTIKLRGPVPNTEAIGARVYVRTGATTQMRELRAGSNFESQDAAEAHFGLGVGTVANEVRVVWPLGAETRLTQVEGNRLLVVSAVDALPTPTAPPTPTATAIPCVGDCDGDGEVTVDEVVRAVTLALGGEVEGGCAAVDRNRDGEVTVDEVLAAVDRVLAGCEG